MDTWDGLRIAVRKLGDPLRFFILTVFMTIVLTCVFGL